MTNGVVKGGYNRYGRILGLGGIDAVSIESSHLEPDVVVTYEGAICVYIEGRSNDVALESGVESFDFERGSKLL